jgi:hypothetical protein
VDETPPEQRSPSPEPIYNEFGMRLNTREQRLKERFQDKRTVRCVASRRAELVCLQEGSGSARLGRG